tara:strand:- start:235 stop:519 length:285 start_codon:yes stop_codon:yes gene_type:complete
MFTLLNKINKINKIVRYCTSTGLKNTHFNKYNIPIIQNKKYINKYEWLCNENNVYKLGINDKALEEFNEIVYVEQLYNICEKTSRFVKIKKIND